MAFKVITQEDAQTLTREFRSITGAKRAIANDLLARAVEILKDDGLWAGRTQRTMRERVECLATNASRVLAYDGPTQVGTEGVAWRIEQDADAPTRQQQSAQRKSANKGHRWLDSVRFANHCAQCNIEVSVGSRAWYESPKLYCEPCGNARQAQAVAA